MLYCPRCGQKQASGEIRFCSRCGFALTEVTGLLARGGAPEEPTQAPSARRRGLKQAAYIFVAVVGLLILMAATNADEVTALVIAIFGFAAAALRALYALIFQRCKPRKALSAPEWQQLSPAPTNPVAVPRVRFDTGEIVEPPSVTEHTTRHLEAEPER
jgi:hypothetical protein